MSVKRRKEQERFEKKAALIDMIDAAMGGKMSIQQRAGLLEFSIPQLRYYIRHMRQEGK